MRSQTRCHQSPSTRQVVRAAAKAVDMVEEARSAVLAAAARAAAAVAVEEVKVAAAAREWSAVEA